MVNASLSEFSARTGGYLGTPFGREDFESISTDHLVIWAAQTHKDAIAAAGYKWGPAKDVSAGTFAAEKARGYMDKEEPDWTEYCGYECMTARMGALAAEGGCAYPLELVSIGQSVQGRELWVVTVGGEDAEAPQVLMVGNIHGDEPVGNMLMQRWIWTTCTQPTDEQSEVARSVKVSYLLNLNPDGYERNSRSNANGFDLNRNYPPPSGSTATEQPETRAYKDYVSGQNFSIATSFHGGAVVCNTAYDNCYTAAITPRPCPPALPDYHPRADDVLPSSKAYCDAMMAAGVTCNVGTDCQVNGAAWYQISGSEQDWAFHFANVPHMTMEITNIKRPGGNTLPGHYENNYMAFHDFMMWPVNGKKH
eukprot:SAG31_NODE_3699_length_3976_cov_2.373227_1_plen_365_part_00